MHELTPDVESPAKHTERDHGGIGGHPRGLSMLFYAEMWERFSYYGMRAILLLFMIAPLAMGGMGMDQKYAAQVYGNYTMASYMVCILGGYLADNFIGARRAVLVGGLIITAGHYALAFDSVQTFYAGLILIALGTGLLKPSISTLVGGLYSHGDTRRDAGFSLFYMGINLGAFAAPLVVGWLAQSNSFRAMLIEWGLDPKHSWHWGFAAAGIGMTFGMIVYLRRLHWLSHIGQAPEADAPRPWARLALVVLGTTALLGLVIGTDQVIMILRKCEGDEIARAFARVAYAEDCKALLAGWGLEMTHRWFWGLCVAGVSLTLGLIVYLSRRQRLSNIGRLAASDAPRLWGYLVLFALGMATLIGVVFGADQIVMTLKACKGDEVANVFARGAYGMICFGLPIVGIIFFGILQKDEESRRIAAIFVFFICAVLFWAVFEQAGSSLTLFADELTRNEIFGYAFPSSWFQSVNSLFILILAPLFAWLWVRLREQQPSIPMKFVLGLAFLGLSFDLLVRAADLTAKGKVSPWWLIAVYFLQTVGELCLSPVGLSAMTKLAPAKLAGLVMGIWFLGTAMGNKLAGVVAAEFDAKNPEALADFFLNQVLIVGGATVLLLALVPWIRRLTGDNTR